MKNEGTNYVGYAGDEIGMPNKQLSKYTDILKECATVGEERMKSYDNPLVSMQIACDILEKTFNVKIDIEQMCYVLVALKMSRQYKSFKEDNIVDSINYLAIALDYKRSKYAKQK